MSTSALSWRRESPAVLGYAMAVLSVAAAVGVDLAFGRLVGDDPSVSLFLCAIMFVAWANGTGPALLATALAILAFDYFFLQPTYSFVLEFKEIPRLVFFAVAALFVVSLSAAQGRAQASLGRVRDQQQETVRELQALNETLRTENAERKRAEQRARLAEQELQLTIDTIPAMVVVIDQDGKAYFANRPAQDYVGDMPIENVRETIHPDDRAMVDELWRSHLMTAKPFQTEQRMRRADGQYRWHFMTRVPLLDETGKAVRWYGTGYDIEDRKRAENAWRASEAQVAEARRELQLTIDSIPVMVSTFEPDGTRSFVNQTWQNYTGHSQREATGKGVDTSTYYHPDDVERFESAWRAAQAKGEMLSVDVRTRRADGAYRWYTMRRAPQRDEKGNVVKWYSVGIDVEDQKIAENALRRSEFQLASAEQELRRTLDLIPTLAWRARADGYAEYLNKRWLDYTGLSQEQALGWKWQATIHPDDRPALHYAWLRMLETGRPDEVEARMRRFDGAYRWFLFRTEALRDEAGAVVAWYGTNIDIEDRKQAESALRRSEAYALEAQELSATGSFAWEVATGAYFWSDQAYQILGFDRSVKPRVSLVIERAHPEDRAIVVRELERSRQGAQNHDYELRLLMPDGQIRYLHVIAHRVKYESGKEEIIGALMDITESRKSQETLQAAQTALAHASRVATLGEISATIAHEVNQPLAAIIANGQACLRFLRREKPDLDDVRGAVEWIVKDGNRAGEVIRRVRGLLKKADTEKTPLDVNDLVNEVAALLRRELAAQEVTPQLELEPAVPPIVADRVQLQQVIINLVMNGAEAMQTVTDRPHRLAIRTYQDETHRVVVAVEDSGPGIASENADRVFDPFFSTKPGGPGDGPFYLPLDCRGPWWPIVVIRQCRAGCHVPVRAATAPGECGVNRSIETRRQERHFTDAGGRNDE